MKRSLLLVALIALLVLAGCSEGTTNTTPATSMDTLIGDPGTSTLSGDATTPTAAATTTSETPSERRTATRTRTPTSTATATESAATTALSTSGQTTLPAASTQPAPSDGQGRRATVTRVVDGDTVEVEFADGTTDTIRLLGVDTPETTLSRTDPPEFEGIPDTAAGRDHLYNWGQQASQFASDQLAGQQVRVVMDPESDERGSYGRLLAYVVYDGGTNFNLELLRQGYARMYDSEFVRRDEFASTEAQAQSSNVGLWDFDGAAATATATPRSDGETVSGNGGGVVTPTPSGPASDPYDCSDFDTRAQVEAVFDPDSDVLGLDSDGDGEACESL
ncbi:thermonuclease family protein [Halococcus sp. PRR34]|uniref:thermonuclease family protein n=1 Tax=Halococcus sp. PRR34 TaxID=3020830 RepID=UPI00235E84EB|nr:thermonuclease family protein [Halococcus sp. PRR34]